jgi:hypothetical protein
MSRASLPAFALLAAAGVGTGIYLGKAAVAEINPMYFSEPETRFHGDLVPYRAAETAGYRAGELSAANLDGALGTGCIGCRTYPEDVVLVHRATSGKAEFGYAEVASEPVQAVAYEQTPIPEFAAVERYSSYPVETAAAVAPAQPSEPVELAAVEEPVVDPGE